MTLAAVLARRRRLLDVAVGAVLVASLLGLLLISRPADHDPAAVVDRGAYTAGWRFATAHRADPAPSGLPGTVDGTRAACQLWFDAVPRELDRPSFLAGCSDGADPVARPPPAP